MRRFTALLAVAISMSLAAATAASAAGPVHEWIPIDETFTWDGCGFEVVEHDQLNLHFVSWFDADGNRTRQVVLAPSATITYTNPDTGASVTTRSPYSVHKTDNPDGSVLISFTGLAFALLDGGESYVAAGRDVIVWSPDDVQLISSAGISADLCEALAATIG